MKPNLNTRIFKQIEKEAQGDGAIISLLHELLFEEMERGGNWWYKDPYRKAISKYASQVDIS